MAARYLTALDYADWHTNAVLRKHAKKRPLGALESRYQYTPTQPVLSCRTVDVDVAGTRTYRPRSTTDILEEQQKLIHNLVKSNRLAAVPHMPWNDGKAMGLVVNGNFQPTPTVKIHTQGRPYTTPSRVSNPARHRFKSSSPRPKTTGRLKNVKSETDSFLELKGQEDLLETRRSQNELTNQIHAHWRKEASHLNHGLFMRGQKRPDDVPPTLDAWLTFGGIAEDDSGGVIDAFANFQSADDYYNIEGSIGNRVAQQLKKGDRIRIGINGVVLTHDLRVKKLEKESQDTTENEKEGEQTDQDNDVSNLAVSVEEEQKQEQNTEEPDQGKLSAPEKATDFTFDEFIFEPFHEFMELKRESETDKKVTTPDQIINKIEKSKMKPKVPEIPLSWDDQVSKPEVKVVSARVTPRSVSRENLCETHPVLFEKLTTTQTLRPRLASATPVNGFRIKQRTAGHVHSAENHLYEGSSMKVKAMTFDHNSPDEEERLSNMSVDDVVQQALDKAAHKGYNSAGSLHKAKSRSKVERVSEVKGCKPPKKIGFKGQQRSTSADAWKASGRSGTTSASGSCHVTRDGGSFPSSTPTVVGRPVSSTPSLLASRNVDLSVMTSACRDQMTGEDGRGGSGKSGQAKISATLGKVVPLHKALGSSSNSINAGPIPGETEFIQIAQPIKNFNPSPGPSQYGAGRNVYSMYTSAPVPSVNPTPLRSNTPQDAHFNSPEQTRRGSPEPSVRGPRYQNLREVSPPVLNPARMETWPDEEVTSERSETPMNDTKAMTNNTLAISIPTAGNSSDRDSPESLSHHRSYLEDEDDVLTPVQLRERSLRDQQIDQITDLLVSAIVK